MEILASMTCCAPEWILFIQTLITVFSWLHRPSEHSVFCGTQTHLGFRGRFCSWSQGWRGKCMLPHQCIWPKTPENSTAAARAVWVKDKNKIQACQSNNSLMNIVNWCVYNRVNKIWQKHLYEEYTVPQTLTWKTEEKYFTLSHFCFVSV